MPWMKIDDTFHSHPKARGVGLPAIGLWTLCGSYSMAYKQDGFVPEWFAHGFQNGKRLADNLVSIGLWEKAVRGEEVGYQFHDWLDVQQSAEEIEADREKARQRQRDFRKRLREGKKKEPDSE